MKWQPNNVGPVPSVPFSQHSLTLNPNVDLCYSSLYLLSQILLGSVVPSLSNTALNYSLIPCKHFSICLYPAIKLLFFPVVPITLLFIPPPSREHDADSLNGQHLQSLQTTVLPFKGRFIETSGQWSILSFPAC